MGTIKDNAWMSYPVKDLDVLNKIKPNYIYISHLHPDHLDPKTLEKFEDKNVKIIIKRFPDGRLKKRINSLGYKNVLECDPWKEYNINDDFSVVLIPQMTSNTDALPEDINYDLDTSILIISKKNKKIFYNNTDNPVSSKDMKKIRDFVEEHFKSKVNIACFPVGASSEYPQCFLGINREEEKEKIIKKSHEYVKKILNTLKPDLFFPAGGTYLICGKFSKLNKYVGLPNLEETTKIIKDDLKIDSCVIEGGKSILIEEKNYKFLNDASNIDLFLSQDDCITKTSKTPYSYELSNEIDDLSLLDDNFKKAKENYFNAMKKKQINVDWIVKFFIYKNITLKLNGNLSDNCHPIKTYEITPNNKSNHSIQELKCHLDHRLFSNLLKRKNIWNVSLSGSFILFEREPNKFIPNVPFSLNYLTS